MRPVSKIVLSFLCILAIMAGGCSNIYEAAADKTTDAALHETAKKAINKQDYDAAIVAFTAMSSDYKTRTDVREDWAGALAGKCGFSFFSFFEALGSFSGSLFGFLMNAFRSVSVDPTYCTAAEAKINEISSDPALRTTSENLFMMLLGMAKVGTYLKYRADADGTGTMDGTFNACTGNGSSTPVANSFSDTEVKEIVTGLGQILVNFGYVTSALSGNSASTSLTDLTNSCATYAGISGSNPCNITDASAVTAGTVTQMRYLIHTSSTHTILPLGIGGCTNLDVTQCCGL